MSHNWREIDSDLLIRKNALAFELEELANHLLDKEEGRLSEAKIRADERRKFVEWLEENSYKYIEAFWQGHSIAEALEVYEKEHNNEN